MVSVTLAAAVAVLAQDTTQGFGGVQLGGGLLSEGQCQALIAGNVGKTVKEVVPCECKVKEELAVACHPHCCPTDRCWEGNAAEWTSWEQQVCIPPTTQGNSQGDGVCVFNGGNPFSVGANQSTITFFLSTLPQYFCTDLVLSACRTEPSTMQLTTLSGVSCYQTCPPTPLTPCTRDSCLHNRGRTHPYIRSWTVPDLPQGAYMLTCVTISRLNDGMAQEVNQTQYLPTAFYHSGLPSPPSSIKASSTHTFLQDKMADWDWDAPDAAAEAIVEGCLAAPVEVEVAACGRAFEEALARWMPRADKAKKEEKEGPGSPVAGGGGKKEKKKRVTSTKLSDAELEGQHYELLGLEDKEWMATEDEIAKAYKKKCLETHPDKTGGDDTLFKAVQVAGDVLMNENKRKAYDSSLPFDDDIPAAKVAPEEFYEEFGPVFKRNGKWFAGGKDKVPPLGTPDTPMEEVDAFYTFWFAFKSWRDFSHEAAEHDLDQAEHREERRWMERENQRKVDKEKKGEMQRILQLVERSYKNDPRIKAREAERAAEKERVREEKRKAEEERKQREAEEAERKAREEEEERKNRKASLQNQKKARQGLRKLMKKVDPEETINRQHLEWYFGKLSSEDELTTTSEKIEAVGGVSLEALNEMIEGLIKDAEASFKETRDGKPIGQEKKEAKKDIMVAKDKKAEAEWTTEELLELQKACVKYPAGAMEWWKKLSDFMMNKKTPEQCLKKVKQLEMEYKIPQQAAAGGMKNIISSKTDLPAATSSKTDAPESNPAWTQEQTRTFKDPTKTEAERPAEKEKEPAEDIWSASQQKALENILRELKAYKEKDKWDKIAAAIEGKTKKQCVNRYKFLCSQVKK